MKHLGSLVLCVAAVGCDPIMTAQGRVAAASVPAGPEADAPYEHLTPIANARLSLSCQQRQGMPRHLTVLAHSDADGRLRWAQVGLWDGECSLVVSANGYADEAFALTDLCAPGESQCTSIAFQAELVPKAGAPAPAPEIAPVPPRTMRVRLSANDPDLTVMRLTGVSGSGRAWEPICRPPCEAWLAKDEALGVSRGEGHVLTPDSQLQLLPAAKIDVHYDDRSTQRLIATILGLVGAVGGPTLMAVGAPQGSWHAENVALVGAGFVAMVAGIEVALTLIKPDSVQMTR